MAFPQAEGLGRAVARILVGIALFALPILDARATDGTTVVSPPQPAASGSTAETMDPSLSPECRVPGSKLYTLAKLRAVKDALAEKRPLRVLSVGTSSAGLGASSSYPVKLENALQRSLPNVEIEVEARGLPGEIASGAAERLRTMIAEIEPDLVVWQVGTNDALARVELDAFGEALDEAVRYVKSHEIDVVLIDPLFTQSMAEDAYYSDMVRKVQEIAARERVPLVRRYEAMRFLSAIRGVGAEEHMLGQQFRLADLGQRCMAEHAARAITLSLLQSESRETGTAAPAAGAQPPATGNATAGEK